MQLELLLSGETTVTSGIVSEKSQCTSVYQKTKVAVESELAKSSLLFALGKQEIRRLLLLKSDKPRTNLDSESGQAILICVILTLNQADILHLENPAHSSILRFETQDSPVSVSTGRRSSPKKSQKQLIIATQNCSFRNLRTKQMFRLSNSRLSHEGVQIPPSTLDSHGRE